MHKEPFILKDSHLFIENWQILNNNLLVGMTTRNGGFSEGSYYSMNLGFHVQDHPHHVSQNREKLARNLGVSLETWVCCEQVHRAKVLKVTKAHQGAGSLDIESAIKGIDGFYTSERNVFLTTLYADCVPLYFFAPKHHLIGIAHAGWRGTVQNIANEMIHSWVMTENVPVEDIFVVIGPSIDDCCYIVDRHVIDELATVLECDEIKNVYQEVSDGQFRLSLKQANKQLLMKAGILSTNIELSNYCTSCEPTLFFSHRRDQSKTGRMLSFIGLNGG